MAISSCNSPSGAISRMAFEEATDAFLVFSFGEGRIVDANPAAACLTEFSNVELCSRCLTGIFPDLDKNLIRSQALLPWHGRTIARLGENGEVPIHLRMRAEMSGSDGLGFAILRRDIVRPSSEPPRGDLSESVFRRMAEQARDCLTLVQPDGRVVFVNRAIEDLLGYSPEQYRIDPFFARRVIHPNNLRSFLTFWEDVGRTGTLPAGVQERLWIHRDGRIVHCEHSYVGLRDADGTLQAVLATVRDVTGHKAVVRALDESKERFRRMVEHLPAGAILLEQGRLFANHGAEVITGYDRAEMISLDAWFAALFPGRADEIRAWYETDKKAGFPQAAVVPIRRKDGAERIVEFTAFADGATEVWLLRDVTESDRVARLLEQTARTAHIGGWELDCRTMALHWTAETYRIHETSPESYVPNVESAIAFYAPESIPAISEAVRLGIERGQGWDLELQLITGRGRRIWAHATGEAKRENERTVKIAGSFQDITERKLMERERQTLEQKLQETQKLESLGVLAGGIAHDFNNLLTVVLGNASLARQVFPKEAPAQAYLEHIEAAAFRAADLCKQMLAYAGKSRIVLKCIDLSELVRDTAGLLHMSVSKKARLDLRLADALPPVFADLTQLRQVLMNLIINASEALGENEGVISVSTGSTILHPADVPRGLHGQELAPGNYVSLKVRDDGHGMTPETLARIFDPFFTTKFTGRGLGLAAVLGIVRGHGGALRVESELGVGTCFTLFLPQAEVPPERDSIASLPARVLNGQAPAVRGTVLIIEDEHAIRQVVARALRSAGMHTVEAQDGRSGLDRFRENPDAFRLILLDLTMPGLGGDEVLRQARQIRPHVPVVLMSGYSSDMVAAKVAGFATSGCLQKPFRINDLLSLVDALPPLSENEAHKPR